MSMFATGCTGIIGRNLSEHVTPLNIRIDTSPATWKLPELSGATIVHLAAAVPTVTTYSEKLRELINVDGAIAIAQQAVARGADRFVFVSTSHVYGIHSKAITESANTEPTNSYGLQKLKAERALHEICAGSKTSLLTARVFSVLDWGTGASTLGGKIERICEAGSTETLQYADDERDFLTPFQVAKALESLAVTNWSGTINICSGVGTRVGEAASRLALAHGHDIHDRIVSGTSMTPRIVGDSTLLTQVLGEPAPVWPI